MSESPPGGSLWDWAVRAYARPGVEAACLHLQDDMGQNVPLLLWAAWTARAGRRPDEDALEEACDAARAWDDAAVAPLRALRRKLKIINPDLAAADREAVRSMVKATELRAERALLDALAAVEAGPAGAPGPLIDGLAAASKAWSRVVPRPALQILAERLSA